MSQFQSPPQRAPGGGSGDPARPGTRHLLRAIGFAGAAVLIVNSVIGSGLFAMPAAVAARAGVLSPWLFVAFGLLMLTVVLTFAELASHFRDSGGPFLYASEAFGPLTGFVAGWALIVSRMTAFATNTLIMVMYAAQMWPVLGEGIARALLIFAVSALLTLVNYLGIKDGVRTMFVLTVLKLTPVVFLVVLGLSYVDGSTLLPSTFPVIEDFGALLPLLIYPFVGFESATILSGETRSPGSTMPRALIATQIGIAVLYFLVVLVYVAVLPDPDPDSSTLVELGRKLMGAPGATLITLAAVFSVMGNLGSILIAVPRLTFAMSQQQLLPAWFGQVHPKFATPGNSILFFGALGLALTLTGSLLWVAAASVLTRLLTYILCIGALPFVRRRAAAAGEGGFRLPGGYTIPAIALLLCVWVVAHSELRAWLATGASLLTGLILYALAARRRPGAMQGRLQR